MPTVNSNVVERASTAGAATCSGGISCKLFESIPLPAWIYDPETLRFLEASDAAVRRYQFSRAEFLSTTILDIHPAEDVPLLLEFLELPVEERQARGGAWRHRTKDGTVFEVEISANAVELPDGTAIFVIAKELPEYRKNEEELRRAEEAFRALFDGAPVPYHEIDRNGIIIRVNQAECEALGMAASAILGRPIWELVSAKDRESTRASIARKLSEGKLAAPFERRFVRADGIERTFQIHERPIIGLNGEVSGIRSAMLDLTEAHEAQRQITFQASLLDQVNDAIVAIDETFRITYWNRAAESMFGRSASEVLGSDYGTGVEDELEDDVRQAFRKRLLETGEIKTEVTCRNRHGDRLVIDLSAHVIRDDSGRVTGAVGIHRDVTERRRAEEALAASESRFRLAQTALGIGTWELDLASEESVCSQEQLAIFGITDGRSGFGTFDEWLSCVHPDDRDLIRAGFYAQAATMPCHREYRVVWPDGSVHWILSKSYVIFDPECQPKRVVGISFDVTAQKQAEEQLRILSSAMEQSPVSILITDLEGGILYSNPKASEVTGYSREELTGKNSRILKSGETSPEEYGRLWATIPNGVWRGTFHNKKKNGQSFWESVTIGPIRDESGRTTHYLAVKEDITQRRSMEAALRHSEERFRVAAQSSGDLIYERDLASGDIQIIACAGAGFPLEGTGEAFDGNRLLGYIHECDRSRVMDQLRKSMETGEPFRQEYRMFLPSGQMRYWSDSGSMLRDSAGRPYKWVGVMKDVTEAREAERENAELAAIVESSETALFTRDLKFSVLSWNAGAELIYGFTAQEMIGGDFRVTVPAERQEEIVAVNERIRAGERVNHLETVGLTRGGARVEVMMTLSPIRDPSGEVVGAAHLVWDISQLRNLQRQLAQAQKLESVGQLAAGIAHEINTPIQYIGDNAEFLSGAFRDLQRVIELQEAVLPALRTSSSVELGNTLEQIISEVDAGYLCEEIPKAIVQLSEGVQHVSRIVRAMKEFSHPGEAEKVLLDLNRAIESTILVSRNEWKYVADLTTELDPVLPPVPCLAGEFNQVILNLVVNAAHAITDMVKDTGQKGRICISTRINGDCAEIRISDTGTGIPVSIRSKIFDPFFTTKEVGKGTGQGLSIAHNVIVKKHSGSLSFETECGVGTTFVIQLPFKTKEDA